MSADSPATCKTYHRKWTNHVVITLNNLDTLLSTTYLHDLRNLRNPQPSTTEQKIEAVQSADTRP